MIRSFSASVVELYGTLLLGEKFRNFTEFYDGLMERNNYILNTEAIIKIYDCLIDWLSGVLGGAPAENKFGALKAVRKPLVEIILNILSTMFYSKTIKIQH